MAKKIVGYVKLQVPAGSATPSPPIGPALGQRGLNIMEFCKAFNAATQELEKGSPIPVVITAYADKSFTFEMKQPPVTYFIKKAVNLKSGSKLPGKEFFYVGSLSHKTIVYKGLFLSPQVMAAWRIAFSSNCRKTLTKCESIPRWRTVR